MNTYLGIELGSTRIKAISINEKYKPISSGSYTWKSDYKDGIWTYNLSEAWDGIKSALLGIEERQNINSVGISGMMHGYLAFDDNWNLLVPFRTWQNTITSRAASELTELFGFNIPQRWSIAHLYQAVLNGEAHINQIAHITTLAGYIHYMLTGVNAVGIGEASGIFPIDSDKCDYDMRMIEEFDKLIKNHGLSWKIKDVLPKVLTAGDKAGTLTEKGSRLIDNLLPVGIPFAPPEGDAGTGMVATNSVASRTGNVSAGTSIFSMVVLENPLKKVREEIDMVTTPDGKPVAMVHCNNCTNDSNAWIYVLKEAVDLFGAKTNTDELYTKLYQKSLEGEPDCGGVLVCNYLAGEGVTRLDSGRPLIVRTPDARFTLANFMRATLYSTMATLKIGMDFLAEENVCIDRLTGHGGLFKTPMVAQKYMAAAIDAPITVMETAGEGGAYGMALLAAFAALKENQTLEQFLNNFVFKNVCCTTQNPLKTDVDGFNKYVKEYKKLLEVEKIANDIL